MSEQPGQRVRLVYTSDLYSNLPVGSEGTVQSAPTSARSTSPGIPAPLWV